MQHYYSKKTTLLLLIIFPLLFGCASTKHLSDREKAFGTSGSNKWSFHRLSDQDKGVSLAFPGFIVSLEKAYRKKIGAPSRKEVKKGNGLDLFDFNTSIKQWDKQAINGQKRRILDDPKPTFVSSIMQYEFDNAVVPHIRQKTYYDAYDPGFLQNPKKAYQSGYQKLDEFGDHILNKIKAQGITHVFVFAMGWNTDQQEALRNYNSLFLKILDKAKNEDGFKPMFIGFTWPSFWTRNVFTNIFSFVNKSNDADEVGMVGFNMFLNQKLLSTDKRTDFKTIVLGHSFGAKLASRAVMSASMLSRPSKPVDLLINLESAYSLNRYSKTKGVEKTPDYEQWQKYADHIALIWSEHDTAVKAGFYAPFAGAKRASVVVNKRPQDYPGIQNVSYQPGGNIAFKPGEKQLFLINGSSVVKTSAYEKGGGAHSDIYNEEVSELLWKLIKSSTF